MQRGKRPNQGRVQKARRSAHPSPILARGDASVESPGAACGLARAAWRAVTVTVYP